jgi:hypothetical protein
MANELPKPSELMRVYVSGPMTGLPAFNVPAFRQMAAQLRDLGFAVENPAENPACGSWLDYMRLDIAALARCDWIIMLPGWLKSRGASIEHRLATDLGLPVFYADGAEP